MRWFNNLKATPRLMIGFGALLVLTVIISYLSVSSLSKANDRVEQLYRFDLIGSDNVNAIAIDTATLGRLSLDAFAHESDTETITNDEKQASEIFANLHTELDEADKNFTTKQGHDALAVISKTLPSYEQGAGILYQKLKAKDYDGAKADLLALGELRKTIRDASELARQLKQEHAEQQFDENAHAYQEARTLALTACIASLLLGAILAIVIARGFALPLNQAVTTLRKVAGGDLTVVLDIDTQDEVGDMAMALNETVQKLRLTLAEVTEGAIETSSSSQQLAAAAESIASGAQEQAASIEETSASLEEITATVRQSADNAQQASQLASGSRDAAEQGQQVVSQAVTAMSEINASSAKIAEIIGTIDEIAFQTNLLAVNAAVEAARAGEEGRGFAVVATEVRSLAQRSAEAAKEIKVLIQDSLRKVERGTELVNKSGDTLQTIVQSVKRVTDIVGEIAAAAGEQSTGIEHVNTAMMQMDQVTQANSAHTEELSTTAESMAQQAERLMEDVKVFTLNKDEKGARAAAKYATSRYAPTAVKSGVNAGSRLTAAVKKTVSSPISRGSVTAARPAVAVAANAGSSEASFEEF
ncbi:methyl-accepting chemotaxis protein [Telmatobacter bradus]|uniref:methyl-accepting chemotaxis protein n=1 Tax=Telmatobacter bradus TaxID=474953 RepID=UPI003B429F25